MTEEWGAMSTWHSRRQAPAGEALRRHEALFHYRTSAAGMLRSVTPWHRIRKEYPDICRAPDLLRRMRVRPGGRKRRDAWALLAFYGAHRLLPDVPFASFFSAAVLQRNRLRAARAKGRPPHGR